jgi:hypothetical protein
MANQVETYPNYYGNYDYYVNAQPLPCYLFILIFGRHTVLERLSHADDMASLL